MRRPLIALAPVPATRADRLGQRNQKLRDAFYKRYTLLPRPKKISRECVVSQLADEFFLSEATVEQLLYASG